MCEAFDKVRRQPEVVRTKLSIVFAFAQRSIGERLSVSVDKLVLLQLIIKIQLADERDWMFQPEWMIGNGLDLFSGLQHPTFAPCIYDPVVIGRTRDEGQWNFENDGVDVYACLAVSPAIDKAKVTFGVFVELISAPGKWTGWEFTFVTFVAPLRIVRIKVEQVVSFEF